MSMVVQHNLTAMNANRMLGLTTRAQAKSTEKLSSGYKINRAADNAAGLSISEKMRKQIRGLTQASNNAQDGISCVQTAEGAMSEVQDMLQRMNELAVQAANGTMSENDRSYIQAEVDQLLKEIDRVSETTKFNETYLLKGDGAGEVKTVTDTYKFTANATGGGSVSFVASAIPTEKTISAIYQDTDAEKTSLVWKSNYNANAEGATFLEISINSNAVSDDGQLSSTTDMTGIYATLDGQTESLAAGNISKYYYINSDGNAQLKEGVQLYSQAGVALPGSQIVSDNSKNVTANASNYVTVDNTLMYSSNNSSASVALSDMKNYFESDGSYKGGLFMKSTNAGAVTYSEVGAECISSYVTVKRATTGLFATDSSGNVYEISDSAAMNSYLTVDKDGNIVGKDGYTLYSACENTTGVQGTGTSDKYKADQDYLKKYIGTSSGMLKDSGGNDVKGSDLASYFDSKTGAYNGGLHNSDMKELGEEKVRDSLTVTFNTTSTNLYATAPNADGTNTSTTEVDATNVSNYFEVGKDGKLAIKDGIQIFSSNTAQNTSDAKGTALGVDDALIEKLVKVTSNALVDSDGKAVAESALANYFDSTKADKNGGIAYTGGLYKADGTAIGAEEIGTYVQAKLKTETSEGTKALELSFHVGADGTDDNKIKVEIASISAKGLGVDGLKIDGKDDKNASAAIETIGNAIQQVSKQRSALGAIQNRLEHTINNLDNVVENTTSAESAIRDTDMAEEMVSYSKNNILAQAGQAMLAQANQSNQGVLSLLG